MRSLLSILISVVCLIPIPSKAEDCNPKTNGGYLCFVSNEKESCDQKCADAIKSAEAVIAAQDKEIELVKKRNDELFNDNNKLQQSLFDAQEAKLKAEDRSILWGVVGLAVGAIAASALRH